MPLVSGSTAILLKTTSSLSWIAFGVSLRRMDRPPRKQIGVGDADLPCSRNILQRFSRPLVVTRERTQLAGFEVRRGARRIDVDERQVAADHVGDAGLRSLYFTSTVFSPNCALNSSALTRLTVETEP